MAELRIVEGRADGYCDPESGVCAVPGATPEPGETAQAPAPAPDGTAPDGAPTLSGTAPPHPENPSPAKPLTDHDDLHERTT